MLRVGNSQDRGSMKKQKVFFIYRKSMIDAGSTIMRVHQLAAIANAMLGEKYECSILRMPNKNFPTIQRLWVKLQPKGAVYFFSKKALISISQSNLEMLQKKAAGICFDYVDANLKQIRTAGVDIHLCSSYSQRNALENLLKENSINGKPMMLLHNTDQRLYKLKRVDLERARIAYLGTRSVTVFNEEIEKRVDYLDASTAKNFELNYEKLVDYNLHYAMRKSPPQDINVVSPFTKGFTAAVLNSNIIINKYSVDAVEFLGEDYPYLVEGERNILNTIDLANDSFGSKMWYDALDVMHGVANRISPKSIATQIEAILKELGV